MLPVYDKPTTQHVVEEAVASGIQYIYSHRQTQKSLEDHFDKYYELEYNIQKTGNNRELRKIRKNH